MRRSRVNTSRERSYLKRLSLHLLGFMGIGICFMLCPAVHAESNTESITLRRGNPWDIGLNWKILREGYTALNKATQEKNTAGAVVIVAKDGIIIRRRAFGYAQLYGGKTIDAEGNVSYTPERRRMKLDTVFDLASLTKMVATTTSMMILIEEGQVDLDDRLAKYLPEFGAEGKKEVTIRHLLTHTSGLPAWKGFYTYCKNRGEIWEAICKTELESPPGVQRVYSDLGFITLGMLVEKVSGERLDRFTKERIFEPLGMKDTGFNPSFRIRKRCAATEWSSDQNKFIVGTVHDENCSTFGGVSGHAGLFSTANDLAVFCQMLLNRGTYGDVRILKPETVALMLTPQLDCKILEAGNGSLAENEQLLGWYAVGQQKDILQTGGLPSPRAFGHTGFTGTSLWIDPEHQTFVVLLANAVHPTREGISRSQYRQGFHQAVWDALLEAEKKKAEERAAADEL